MSLDIKMKYVNDYFLRKDIKVDAEWLNGCIQFFLEENATILNNQLCEKAQEQWELSDLSDSGVPCLPQSIRNQKGFQEINGTCPVQLQYLIDISESAYDQLQKIRDKEVDIGKEQHEFKQSQPVKNKKKRVLKLELTDGYQIVTAMEYSPIPCLKTSLVPGTKLLLIGPIRCINHCLLIESKNIQILAGEVSSMTIENAYENVLRRILNLPINPNPKMDEIEQTVDNIPSVPMTETRATQQIHAMTNTMDVDVDDDFFCGIDVDQLTSRVTVSSGNVHSNNNQTPSRSVMLFDDDMDDEFLQINDVDLKQNTHHSVPENELYDIQSQIPPLNVSICSDNYPFRIRGVNLVTLKQLNECSMDDRLRRKHFLVKAEIDAVQERVRISREKNTFKLGVLLKDSPARQDRLKVRFSSEVLEKSADVTPREIEEMFAKQGTNPQVLACIAETLDKLGMELTELNAFLKIEFVRSSEVPVVVEIIKSAKFLEQKLTEKLTRENLLD